MVRFGVAQELARRLLEAPQRYSCLAGGTRSGKTFLIVHSIVARALSASHSRHAILRFHANAARASIALDTLPNVMRLCFPGIKLKEHRQDGFFELPNRARIWIGGLDDKERVEKILGLEYVSIFLNEASQIPYASALIAFTRLAQSVPGLVQRAYIALATDRVIALTSLSAARTITLPSAAGFPAGTPLRIADLSGNCSASDTLTINRAGSDTINGATAMQLSSARGFVTLICDGASQWIVCGRSVNVVTFASSATYKPSPGLVFADVYLFGGGGGGGGGALEATSTATSGGAGGGSGGFNTGGFTASEIGGSQTIIVGAGGASGIAATTNTSIGTGGSAGLITSFGSLLKSSGGGGGAPGQLNATASGGGGPGSLTGGGNGSSTAGGAPGYGGATGGFGAAPGGATLPYTGGGAAVDRPRQE